LQSSNPLVLPGLRGNVENARVDLLRRLGQLSLKLEPGLADLGDVLEAKESSW